MSELILRDETPADIPAVRDLLIAAFRDHPFSHQTEHRLMDALRAARALSVALVVERDGRVLGQVACSPVCIDGQPGAWQGLGPLAVEPGAQRQGIGRALMEAALARLRAQGAAGCVLAGDPAFYARFGFAAVPGLSLAGVPPQYFLALSFGGEIPRGAVDFHPAFAACA